jgi:uncharacterized protein YebE (UPF0316 family)
MSFIESIPVWLLALIIFALRIVDVSLGTVRTIAVVQGWIKLSVVLGFFEVLIWIAAISQVFARINESPVLMLAFAGGFAAGNAAGITLERVLALGSCAVRFISSNGKGGAIAAKLRAMGQRVTIFHGEGRDGPRAMVYVTCERRELPRILEAARAIDEHLFFAVDRVAQTSHPDPLPHPTGWRAVFKMK